MNYVERHFGDWARDTAHLSMLEDGAYNRLVDLYYVRETPLPLDLHACCRLVRAVTTAEREAVRSVLAEFFSNGPDGWTHKRCDTEIERFRNRSGKARASANARWDAERTHSEGNANADANALPTHNEGNATRGRGQARSHSPIPTTQTPVTNKRGDTPLKPPAWSRPEWVPAKEWANFEEHRKAMRGVPFTDAARDGVVRELAKFKAEGHDPGMLLSTAITRGWRTVFAPQAVTLGNGSYTGRQKAVEDHNRAVGDAWLLEQEALDAKH
jgi:uncharacterized protein YdaU (DUF1376 family)